MILAHAEIAPGEGHKAGRQLLQQLYRQQTGNPLPPVERTALGKPFFAEADLHFSITHTLNHAFCVLSDRPVGIDAEELTRRIDPRLADKLLSPSEKEQYEKASDKNKALLTFWVLKEAQGKCSGKGLQLWPNYTDFSLNDPRVQQLHGCLVAIIEE